MKYFMSGDKCKVFYISSYIQDFFHNLNGQKEQFWATALSSSITISREIDQIMHCFVLITCLNSKMSFGKLPILDKKNQYYEFQIITLIYIHCY